MEDSSELDYKLQKIVGYTNEEEYDKAEKLVLELNDEIGTSSDILCILAHIKFKAGHFEGAEVVLNQALELDQESVVVWLALGLVYNEWDDKEKTQDVYQRALDLEPDNFDALMGLGTSLYGQGKKDEAEDVLRRAMSINPTSPAPYVTLGFVELVRTKWLEAEELFRRAIQLDATNLSAWGVLHIVLSMQGREEESEEAYTEFQRIVEELKMQDS